MPEDISTSTTQELSRLPMSDPGKTSALLDVVSQAIDSYHGILGETQRRAADVFADKQVLVVDSSFGVPTLNIQARLKYLREFEDAPELASLILQKALRGRVPRSTTDLYRLIFGDRVKLVHRDVRYRRGSEPSDSDGMFLTGSPAYVTERHDRIAKASRSTSMTNADVFDRVNELHEGAISENLPVFGACYGLQIITHRLAGEVVKMEDPSIGLRYVGLTRFGRFSAYDVFDLDIPPSGVLHASHGDMVLPNPRYSREMLRTVDDDSPISHGTINISPADGRFSGNQWKDARLIKELLADGRYLSLGLQPHFEITFLHNLFRKLISNAPLEDYDNLVQMMDYVKSMVELVTEFFAQHKNFNRPKVV